MTFHQPPSWKQLSLCLLLALGPKTGNLCAAPADENQADFGSLKAQVAAAVSHLDESIQAAKKSGRDTGPEEVTLTTAKTFQVFADYDFAHRDELTQNFLKSQNFQQYAADQAATLPERESSDCLKMLAAAEERLAQAPSPKSAVNWFDQALDLDEGYFHVTGNTVFPHTINWLPARDDYFSAFGGYPGCSFSLGDLKPDGSLKPSVDTELEQNFSHFSPGSRNVAIFFLMHSPAKWMLSAHPEIKQGARFFTRYDIDNPNIREWMRQLISAVAAEGRKAAPNSTRLYLIANEPHFSIAKGGWLATPVSTFTRQKFHQWLAAHYSDIGDLNARWQSHFSSFDEVPLDVPVDPKLIGTPPWYDYCRFNMDRVTDWFTFLRSTIKEFDPDAKVTMKNIGTILEHPGRDNGIDLEALVKLQDVVGADARTVPADAHFKVDAGSTAESVGWRQRDALDWAGQSMMLSFSKSLRPDAPFYDSEWHGFGAEGWLSFDLRPDYVRTALWMGFLDGMGMIEPWYWGRKDDGSPNKQQSLMGSLLTQPLALDAYGRTMKELNAHGNEISLLARAPRKIDLLYVEESAIQELNYPTTVKTWYEAACQSGVPVGFMTPSTLRDLPKEDAGKILLLIPPALHASDETVQSVLAAIGNGMHVATPDASRLFSCDPWGAPRKAPLAEVSMTTLSDENFDKLAASISSAYRTLFGASPVQLQDIASLSPDVAGIWSRSVETSPTGHLLALVNVSKETKSFAVQVSAQGSITAVSLLSGKSVDPAKITLAPFSLDLLQIQTAP